MSTEANTRLLERAAERIDELTEMREQLLNHPARLEERLQACIDSISEKIAENDLEGLYETVRASEYDYLQAAYVLEYNPEKAYEEVY